MLSRDFREHLNHLMIIESFLEQVLWRSVQMEQFAITNQISLWKLFYIFIYVLNSVWNEWCRNSIKKYIFIITEYLKKMK